MSQIQDKADNAYCDFIAKMRRDLCLGAEFKIERGIFTKDNLKAFEEAYTLYGKHVAYADCEKDYATLQAELDALRRENERLKAPVSDEEWRDSRGLTLQMMMRYEVDAMIAERVAQSTQEK